MLTDAIAPLPTIATTSALSSSSLEATTAIAVSYQQPALLGLRLSEIFFFKKTAACSEITILTYATIL
jgi:hypothetical protein